ncbi:MAG: hypothetical protein H6523_13035 [Mycolicibacterium sp.]|nr:hypothetical protein [Mycolicibacterium sp.]
MLDAEARTEREAEEREARIRARAAHLFNERVQAENAKNDAQAKAGAEKKATDGGSEKKAADGGKKSGAAKAAAADAGDRAKSAYAKQREFGHKVTDGIAARMQQVAVKHEIPGLSKVPLPALQKSLKLVPLAGNVVAGVSAFNAMRDGRWDDFAFDLLSMCPGPVSWVAMGAHLIYDWSIGKTEYNTWASPDDVHTHTLPGSEDQSVIAADEKLTTAQKSIYNYSDGSKGVSWKETGPAQLVLDSPEVKKAVTDWLNGIAAAYADVETAMTSSGEPYILEYRDKLAPTFAAMKKLPEQAELVMAQLKAAGDSAWDGHTAFRNANQTLRQNWSANGGKFSGDGTSDTNALESAIRSMQTKISGAEDNINGLFTEQLTPLEAAYGVRTVSDEKKKPDTKPDVVTTPTTPATTPQTKPEAKPETKPDTTMDKLLDQLGKQTNPASNLGTNPMGSNPLTGLGQQSPSGQGLKDLGKSTDEPKKIKDPAEDKKSERREIKPLTGVDNKQQQQPAPAVAPLPAPGSGTEQPKPGAHPKPGATTEAKPETKVDVKGKKGVEFPDAKTAKMAKLLAGADPAKPLSLADAAAQSGLKPPVPGQDLGQQIAPSKSQPGDILAAGDKRFMVLGDGQFYDLQKYDVVGADQVPTNLGDRGGYFRLPDAGDTGSAGTAPVSGPAPSDVGYQVPGGQTPATEPTAVPPLGQSGPGDGGITSSGTPGIPTAAKPGNGPANAQATDTGAGGTKPSVTPPRMDPGAVG